MGTGRSKTKEKILRTALGLFNNEGEGSISSVDIAAVMGISPGNLYYHYKGKDAIIQELFNDFETEMRLVLGAPVNRPMNVEDNWIYLYIIFEEIFDFRFFYYNLTAMLERNPELAKRFSRLLSEMSAAFERLLSALENKGHLVFMADEKDILSERLTAHFTYWFPYMRLRGYRGKTKALIHEGVYAALTQITPYWAENAEPYSVLLKEFFDEQKG
ncbi:MAG TPA: TetR/AcrR family transcriptional regulator [Hellea balneolensis]|uniref:TetR/AcrR family transcriptional regulator n=1 Tax=Hellea balneolensis TaxID=287478 RepID=A0A7C5R7X7_9PROT|nr:TetR/AcrR family transcriptional regulator [Hellea balneolensis]